MKYQIFKPYTEAEFLDRPNRFVVNVRCGGKHLKAHCPNPGRMRELLLPGCTVFLEKSDKPERRTPWTLAAVRYREAIIPLISHRSNQAAGTLILPGLFPGFATFPEKTLGDSRIDWFLKKGSDEIWTEIKSCTLVERQRAMFPDAPSLRALKHLRELMAPGLTGHVIFTVMNPDAQVFSANPHTDPDFSIALKKASDAGVHVHAVSLSCDARGWLKVIESNLPVDFSAAELALRDEGVIVGIWQIPDGSWRLNIERKPSGLSKAARSRRIPEGIPNGSHRDMSLPIRGSLEIFKEIEEELRHITDSDNPTDILEENPVFMPKFLPLILDYRHRRVFIS